MVSKDVFCPLDFIIINEKLKNYELFSGNGTSIA